MQDRFRFRVWNEKNKEYIYDAENGVEIYDYPSGLIEYLRFDDILKSNSLILEQCTGLRDKNGKLIYEGDIVETHDDITEYSHIAYDNGCYVLERINTPIYNHLSNYEGCCEIVGNIHENPELLEDK